MKRSECGEHIYIPDDKGQNDVTFTCDKSPDHKGKHRERHWPFVMKWDREDCDDS